MGVALVLIITPWPRQAFYVAYAQAEEEVHCQQGEQWLECKAAAGDPLAKYRLGRTAYDNARETGDFSEPLRIGRELVAQNERNGKRLLKMTHLQLSWGNHKDYVQAYVWLVEDRESGIDYLDPLIRNLGDKMTPEQLARAKVLTGG
ncbi:MAG: hypothetical protein GTO41_01045 [Burkholderiales bacterium]|nr:hypothetical protein [Burkholderiales bacterium]